MADGRADELTDLIGCRGRIKGGGTLICVVVWVCQSLFIMTFGTHDISEPYISNIQV